MSNENPNESMTEGSVPPVLGASSSSEPANAEREEIQGAGDAEPAPEASEAPAAEDPSLPDEYRPRKRRWPAMVAAVMLLAVLCIGAAIFVQKAFPRRTVVPAQPMVMSGSSGPTPSAAASGGEYGDMAPRTQQAAPTPSAKPQPQVAPSAPLPGVAQANVVAASAQASRSEALPGVGAATPGPDTHSGVIELAVPQIVGGTPGVVGTPSSGSSTGSNEYGDGGLSSGDVVGYRSTSGRPTVVVRSKDERPEQYYDEVTPRAMMVARRRANASPDSPANVQAAQRARDPRMPTKGSILGGSRATAAEQEEPFAPSDRLIACELIFAVDSLSENAPIIALTTQDVIYDGRVIVPKNTEIFGRVGRSYYETESTGRIVDQGTWRMVLPAQPGQRKGRELVVHGRALTRRELVVEPSGRVRQWDAGADGSPGLFGRAITTRDQQEVKKAFFDILRGVVTRVGETQKDKDMASTAVGGVTMGDAATVRNLGVDSVAGGVSGLLDARAQAISEQIARSGTYVAVDSGAKFYLFVEEPLLPASASRGRVAAEQLRVPSGR